MGRWGEDCGREYGVSGMVVYMVGESGMVVYMVVYRGWDGGVYGGVY